MAEAESDHGCLKEAILLVWTPAVGIQSIQDIWTENILAVVMESTNNSDAFIQDHLYVLIRGHVEVFCKYGFQSNVAKYFDNHGPFQLEKLLVSGSWSEGLFVSFESSAEVTPPDVDFMCVLKNIKFTASDQMCGNLTVREDTPFVNAYITDEACAKLWKDFLHDPCDKHLPNKHQLSSFKLKEKLRQNYSSVGNLFRPFSEPSQNHIHSEPESAAFTIDNDRLAEHTPILSTDSIRSFADALYRSLPDFFDKIKKGYEKLIYKFLPSSDIVLALSCDGWPLSAREWITRERIWPDEDLVKLITRGGFHIVPKSSPEGDFRLSFSFAETTLIKHWSTLQHKVVRSFKAVVKYHQNTWSPNIKEIISSYHLKTIAFWHFEKTAQNSLTEESVATHLVLLLQELADALRKLELPMYFMPNVNLWKGVENYDEAINVFEKVTHLSTNYVAITHTLVKLAKLDLNTAHDDLLKDIIMVWKGVKETKSSDFEDQSATPTLILSIFTHLLQNVQDMQQEGLHNDSERMLMEEYLCLYRNMLDFMVNEVNKHVS